MTKVAVVFADGFEEIEALSPVDVFRRAGFDCSMLGLESASVTGSHGIQVAMDGVFDGNLRIMTWWSFLEVCLAQLIYAITKL